MKEHAKRLMSIMKFPDYVINNYNKDIITFSYKNETTLLPVEILQEVKRIEKEYEVTVYHVLKTHTDFGTCIELLCITFDEDCIDEDIEAAKRYMPFAYVINQSEPMFSEFGTIKIKTDSKTIRRVG
jgi:hypothetical protein